MFTKFRRLLSLIIVACMAVVAFMALKHTGAVEGAWVLMLKQALFLFGGIGLILFFVSRNRATPKE